MCATLLGRSFSIGANTFQVLQPGIVTDLSFATQPPAGSILGDFDCVTVAQGMLKRTPIMPSGGNDKYFGLVMGLPSVPGATRLRARHRALLEVSDPPSSRVVIVATDGTTSELSLTGTMADQTAPLLGPAPHYLVIDQTEPEPGSMCSLPSYFHMQGYELDELELVP